MSVLPTLMSRLKIETFPSKNDDLQCDLTLDRRASNIFLTTNSCLLGGQDCDLFRGFSQLKKKAARK